MVKIKCTDKTYPKIDKIPRNLDTPESIEFWKKIDENAAIRQKEEESILILKELGIVYISASDILDLLKDEVRLKEVLSKLKMKAFW